MKKKIFSTLLLVAFALASTSMFVSCKDYEDDINANTDRINALKASLESALAQCKSDCQAAHATFATTASVDALKAEIASLAKASDLQAALDRITALENAGYLTQSDLNDLYTQVAAVDQKIADALASYATINYVDAATANLQSQIDALNAFKTKFEAYEAQILAAASKEYVDGKLADKTSKEYVDGQIQAVKDLITALEAKIPTVQSYPADNLTADEVAALKELLNKSSEEITKLVGDQINILQFLVNKRVTSIVFKPEIVAIGIEAVEVPALAYQPIIVKQAAGYNEHYVYTKTKAPTTREYDNEPLNLNLTDAADYSTFRNNPWIILGEFDEYDTDTYGMPSKAYYRINPQTASLKTATLSFDCNPEVLVAEEVESKGFDVLTDWAVPTKKAAADNAFQNGILEVEFTVPEWKAYFEQLVNNADGLAPKHSYLSDNIAEYYKGSADLAAAFDKVNFIALNVNDNDTTVSSDWAMVVPAIYHINGLADNLTDVTYKSIDNMPKCNNKDYTGKHIYKNAKDAIDNDYTHQVLYNGSIDLKPFVETHFTYIGINADYDSYEQIATDAQLELLGLEYVYTIVDYEDGNHVTGESKHIQQDATIPSKFYPRSVTAAGETIKDTEATREAIDREPLVKVELKNKKSGDVYEVGYIKLKIVESINVPLPIEPLEFTFNFDEDEYVNCGVGFSRQTTWSEIENLVLAKLGDYGYTKTQFETEYTVDDPSNYADLVQYIAVGEKAVNKIGVVEYTQDDMVDLQTNIIKWTVTDGSDIANIYKLAAPVNGVNTKELKTIVRFYKKVGSGPDIYVTLSIPVGKLHFAQGEIKDTKVLAYWFNLNSNVNAQNKDNAFETRVNVPVPTPADNVLLATEFTKDLHDYFLDKTIALALDEPAKYPSFASLVPQFEFTLPSTTIGNASFDASATGTWTVKGLSGTPYTLHLGDANMTIYCGIVPIVKLDNTGVATYVEGEIADDILNYKGHNELGELETFTAYVQITLPDACYPIDLKGTNWFNVRFVRPLDLDEVKGAVVEDAPNDWQPIDLAKLVTVTDWRDYIGDPTNSNGGKDQGNKFDYAYYGVELMTDLANIMTDANLGTDDRSDDIYAPTSSMVAWSKIPNLKLQYKAGSTTELEYLNNSGIVGDFHFYIPVYMKYVFGNYPKSYQFKYAVVKVKKSTNQQTAKKR